MKLASRLAARVLVVWLLTTTAPVTITSACTVVSRMICATSMTGGRQVRSPKTRLTR